jgi:PAS domain S-box-containing protein
MASSDPANPPGKESVGPVAALQARIDNLAARMARGPEECLEALPTALDEMRRALAMLKSAGAAYRDQGDELTAGMADAEADHRRYHDLFQHAPIGYLVTDLAGRILEANVAAGQLLGIAPAALVGRPLAAQVAPSHREALRACLTATDVSVPPPNVELDIVPDGGKPMACLVTASPVAGPFGGRVALRWTLRDIAARKQAAQAYETLVENSLQGIVVVQDGCIVYANPMAERILGAVRTDLAALSPEQLEALVLPEDLPHARRQVKQHLAGRGATEAQPLRIRRPDGAVRALEALASRIRYHGRSAVQVALVDVTERREAQEALVASEERYRRLVKTAGDPIFVADAETGRIVECNARAAALVGRPVDQIVGMHQGELHPPEDAARYQMQFHDDVRDDGAVGKESRVLRADGSVAWVEISASIYEAAGRRYVMGIFHDVTDRKRAEDERRAAEARYRALVENMSSAVAVYEAQDDGERFVIRDFSRGAERIEAVGRADVIGKEVREAFPSAGKFGIVDAFRRVWKTGRPERFPAGWYEDERIAGWRENYIYRLPTGEVVAVYDDVTEQRRAQEALRVSEANLRTVLRAAPVGVGLVRDRVLGWTNETLQQMLGYAAEELRGRNARMLYESDEEYERVGRIKHPLVRQFGMGAVETRMRRKDGQVIDVHLSSAAIDPHDFDAGLVFTVMDITQRKAAQEEVRRQRDFANGVVDTAQAVIVILDPRGRILRINRYALDLLGYAEEDLLGRDYAETLVAQDERDDVRRVIALHGRGEPPPVSERRLRSRDGREFVIRWHLSMLRDAQGRITGLLGVGENVTELRRVEDQLRQSQKMEAIGRLAGGVAHDFNNQLTVIQGYAEILAHEVPADSPQAESLRQVRAAADRAARLTSHLLAFSRRQMLRPEILDMGEVIDEVADPLRRLIGEHIALEICKADGLWPAKADRGQIQQALFNLVTNACDAMPRGGQLTVETANAILDEAYAAEHPDARPGPHVMLAVSDTGTGMDAETQRQVFEPFFTTKPVGAGTGLGLAMVYGFVRQSGGHVAVYSEPGRGTTVRIYLPHAQQPDEPAPAATAVEQVAQAAGGHVLVVEDEETVRHLVSTLLTRAGYNVTSLPHAAEAVTLLRDPSRQVDLVVTDVVMPGVSGPELADQAAACRPGLPVLFITGYTEGSLVARGELKAGASVLSKPFTSAQLLAAVHAALCDEPPEAQQ